MAKQQSRYGNPANYNATPDTRTDGDPSALEVDASGNLKVNMAAGASAAADLSTGTPGTTPGTPAEGLYQTTPSTVTNNQLGIIAIDTNRNVKVTEATLLAGEDLTNNVIKVEQRFSYSHINSNTTTTVKSGAGFLHAVIINSRGASSNTATVYDNTAGSGNIIAVIDTTLGSDSTMFYDVSFATGLTIVTATGTAGSYTVSYR